MMCVYSIKCKPNGRIYIGSTVNFSRRHKEHRRSLAKGYGCNAKLQRAWDKYGEENFTFEVIEAVDNPNILAEREQHHCERLKTTDKLLGFNLRPICGSNFGYKHSLEARARMSLASKGRGGSIETRAKISAAQKGRKQSPEVTARIRESRKGYKHSELTKQKIGESNKGKQRTKDQKRRIKEATVRALFGRSGPNLGRKFGPEVGAKISASKKGKPSYSRTPEIKMAARDKMIAFWQNNPHPPPAPKQCINCKRNVLITRYAKCGACSEYFRRKGINRPIKRREQAIV